MEEYIEVGKEDRLYINKLSNQAMYIFIREMFESMYSTSLIRQEAKKVFNVSDEESINKYIKYLLDKEEEEDRKKKEEFIKKYNNILDK